VGGLLVTSIAAGLAAVASVRKFEVRESAPAEAGEAPTKSGRNPDPAR